MTAFFFFRPIKILFYRFHRYIQISKHEKSFFIRKMQLLTAISNILNYFFFVLCVESGGVLHVVGDVSNPRHAL